MSIVCPRFLFPPLVSVPGCCVCAHFHCPSLVSVSGCLVLFEVGTLVAQVAQNYLRVSDFKILIFLHFCSAGIKVVWVVLPCSVVLRMEPRASCMFCKHSTVLHPQPQSSVYIGHLFLLPLLMIRRAQRLCWSNHPLTKWAN